MRESACRSGWLLLLVVALGLALGAWLAVWVAGSAPSTPSRGEPSAQHEEGGEPAREVVDGESGLAMLQVVQAGAPGPPLRLRVGSESSSGAGIPRILLVALPTFGARQRALLFIRPADPDLCRSLHGVELAVQWNGAEPTAVCAVGDPPGGEQPSPAAERLCRRWS